MDFEKYYKIDRDENYTLHFLNKNALSIPEIKSIFSEFGNVINVNVTKDERGFRFVKYKTLEEVICCLNGLQDGSKIQLLPEKSKLDINKRDCSQQGSRTPNFIHDENSAKIRESHIHTRTSNRNGKSDNFSGNNYIPNDRKSSLSLEQQTFKESNFSDATKNYELFYKRITQENTYMVHFINKRGLSLEKIKELFSRYGDVLSVHCGGGNNGLRFVKYQTLDEVLRCIKDLENDVLITLLPQKDKMGDTNTTNQGSLNQRQAARTGDASQKTFRTGKQFNSDFIHNGLDITLDNGEPINKTKTSHWNNSEGSDNFSDTASHSSRQENTSNANGNKYRNNRNIGPQMSNRKYSFSKQQNPVNNETYDQVMGEKQQETKSFPSIKNGECIKMDRNTRISTNDKIPALISNREMKPKESDAMSDCSSLNGTFSSKIVFIPMQEIIVANIHTKYSMHYILHLFEKHCPISATLVKTIADTNIRYCHVYFKTVDDAIAVEEEFDNFDLSGKNLIVLRKSRFIDETICK